MIVQDFYAVAMEKLGAVLTAQGFSEHSLEFRRVCDGGFDRVTIALVSRDRFSILLSYYPDWLEWVYRCKIRPNYDPEFGYPCGPYLNPVRVHSTPKSWGISDPGHIQKSFAQARNALENVGLPWLGHLKDASFYAQEVMKDNFAFYGAALEEAGRLEEARVQYLRRIDILNRCTQTPRLPVVEREKLESEISSFMEAISRIERTLKID